MVQFTWHCIQRRPCAIIVNWSTQHTLVLISDFNLIKQSLKFLIWFFFFNVSKCYIIDFQTGSLVSRLFFGSSKLLAASATKEKKAMPGQRWLTAQGTLKSHVCLGKLRGCCKVFSRGRAVIPQSLLEQGVNRGRILSSACSLLGSLHPHPFSLCMFTNQSPERNSGSNLVIRF